MSIVEDLDLGMRGPGDDSLQEQLAVAEGRDGFTAGEGQRLGQAAQCVYETHALAPDGQLQLQTILAVARRGLDRSSPEAV